MSKALRRGTRARGRRRLLVETLESRLYLSVDPVFQLHSNPAADHTVYLDFDGHVTENTTWNSAYGVSTIVSPAYDLDGDPSTFNSTEIQRIEAVWKWVAEDFAPFEVDVTTEDPGPAALSYSGSGDTQWGVRVVITDDTFANCGCGGHAYIGSFDDSQDEPVFVYNSSLKGVSEASSHEVGHAMLLSHDGTSSASYYTGHGSGATSWAPLMGVSYNRNVTQWSKGDYFDANNGGSGANYGNGPDDLAIITSLTNGNGFGYRADQHGDTNAAATSVSSAGGTISASGIIEQTSDVDVFSFSTGAGSVTIDIDPAATGPNLDIRADLYDSGGALVATSDPASVLDASFSLTLAAGQYFLHVDGTGTGNPLVSPPSGYTEYGSLGAYSISGTVVDPGGTPTLSVDDATAGEADGTIDFRVVLSAAQTGAVTVDYATADGTAAAGADYTGGAGTLTFAAGETVKWVNVPVIDDSLTEPDETLFLNLSNASGAALGDGQGQGTIVDNDVAISIDDASVNEGNLAKGKKNGGQPTFRNMTFNVSLSAASTQPVTVDYATADGTATVGDGDYQAASGTVTFAPGQTTASIQVTIVGDNTVEENETFSVTLSNPQGGSLADGTANGTILDDDTKGGGKGKKKAPRDAAPAEIEFIDPIWWFEGPEADHHHHHHHHHLDDGHAHEAEETGAPVGLQDPAGAAALPVGDPAVSPTPLSETVAERDQYFRGLAVDRPSSTTLTTRTIREDASEGEQREELLESIFAELDDDLLDES